MQLKKLFFHLKFSEKKFHTPSGWAFAFKDEGGVNPINVMQQQDAQEFFQLFCDRIEQYHAQLNESDNKDNQINNHFLENFFAGKLCNQMFQTSPPLDSPLEVREQEESFVCMSLEVKGMKNLEASLEKFVTGEQINEYLWNENDKSAPRVNITKRQCVSQLSDTVVFHLKRFELDFDTFRREKVNDLFPFPLQLNMKPYTKVGLGIASGGVEVDSNPPSYYEYELSGVVVHTGTADSGHYFSYIKEFNNNGMNGSNSKGSRWLEFNDSEVSEFAESRLEAECFGGTTTTHEYHSSSETLIKTETTNPKNAYMLVYRRIMKVAPPLLCKDEAVTERNAFAQEIVIEMHRLKAEIDFENAKQKLNVRILCSNHVSFYLDLLSQLHRFLSHSSDYSKFGQLSDICNELFVLIFVVVSHTTLVSQYKGFVQLFIQYMNTYKLWETKQKQEESIFNFAKKKVAPVHMKIPLVESDMVGPFTLSTNENDEEVEVTLYGCEETKSSYVAHSANKDIDEGKETVVGSISILQRMMLMLVVEVEKLVTILYASRDEIRTETVSMVLQLFQTAFEHEGKMVFLEQSYFDASFGLMTGVFAGEAATVMSPGTNSHIALAVAMPISLVDDDEDEDLALAIKMSQGFATDSSSASFNSMAMETCVTPSGSSAAAALHSNSPTQSDAPIEVELIDLKEPLESSLVSDTVAVVDPTVPSFPPEVRVDSASSSQLKVEVYQALSPRFIIAITSNEKMQYLVENWRRSGSMQLLLCELAKLNSTVAEFLVSRQLISQIVDAILGKTAEANLQLLRLLLIIIIFL